MSRRKLSRRKMVVRSAIVGVVSALGLAACGGASTQAGASGKTAGKGKTIDVGLLGSLSGPIPLPSFTNAAVAYFKYTNAHGGVDGYKYTWQLVDDANTGPKAATLARSLVEADHVEAMLGLGSTPITAVKAIAPSLKVPILMGGDGALFTPAVSNMFTFGPDYLSGWKFAANVAKDTLHATKVGLIYSNDAFGKPALTALKSYGPKVGVKLVTAVSIPVGTTDFTPIVQKLKSSGAPVVMVSLEPPLIAGVIKAAQNIGFSPKWISNWGVQGPPVVAALGPTVMPSITSFNFVPPLTSNAAGTAAYKEGMTEYAPKTVTTTFAQYGWDFSNAITIAAKKLVSKHEAVNASNLTKTIAGFHHQQVGTIPNVTFTKAQHYGVTSLAALKYSNGKWVVEGKFKKAPAPGSNS